MFRRVAALVFLSLPAAADTYYLSASGVDIAGGGTRAQPWATFAFAMPMLAAGDEVVLLDGTYGAMRVDCTGGPAGVVVRADHERRAIIRSDGLTSALSIGGCTRWSFSGLYVRSQDAAGASDGTAARLDNTSGVRLSRMLFSHPNRRTSADAMLLLHNAADTLVEESEFYFFHGQAAQVEGGPVTFRRDYFNSRGWADLAGAPGTYVPDRGESAIFLVPCTGCLVENCISEGASSLLGIAGYATPRSQGNRVIGSVSLGELWGSILSGAPPGPPLDTSFDNYVAVSPLSMGVFARSSDGTRVHQCSVVGSVQSGFIADLEFMDDGGEYGDGAQSFYVTSSFAVGDAGSGYGFKVVNQVDAEVSSVSALGFSVSYEALGAGLRLEEDPQLGACKVYLPASSPMKWRSADGGDIGANVLYRVVDGGLTRVPLWGPAFPCGATVAGVNDDPSTSCSGVHLRLDVGTPGCPLPADYFPPDAGGTGGGSGGSGGSGGGSTGGSGGEAPVLRSGYAIACTCSSGPDALALFVLLLLVLRRPSARTC